MSSDHSRSFALVAAVVVLLFFAYVFIGMQKDRQQRSTESPAVMLVTTAENTNMENASSTPMLMEENKVAAVSTPQLLIGNLPLLGLWQREVWNL